MIKKGIYEELINNIINEELNKIPEELFHTEKINSNDSSKIISNYIAEKIKDKLDEIAISSGKNAIKNQIELANKILSNLDENLLIHNDASQLLDIFDENDLTLKNNKEKKLTRPLTSIAYSSLFTGAINEPQMLMELQKEIISSDSIDILVSFIRRSGLNGLKNQLEEFVNKGKNIRVICTPYMGATELEAVIDLCKLDNTKIKISYDVNRTRLHAKAYIFNRENGFTTAYVGSSNITNAALTSGLEWNLKIAQKDMNDTIIKIKETFESYWNDPEFIDFTGTDEDIKKLSDALNYKKDSQEQINYIFDIKPYSYQQEILDKLEFERKNNNYKNLIVAATGCGKTVISAFDFLNYKKENKNANLLFIAHREEILKQSLRTFRGILKDNNFGDYLSSTHEPYLGLNNLFVTIQSYNSRKLYEKLNSEFYDFVIIDEFHHAAAESYQMLLSHIKPKVLLGLTATPERMDGEDILKYFNNKITAEIRLPEAIDRKLLCPFQYFGISDDINYENVAWSKGKYSELELTKLYIDSDESNKRVDLIVRNINKYCPPIDKLKALGFCCSIEHANYMAESFNRCNIPSLSLNSNSSKEERAKAKGRLENGDIKVIFTVDLYNEGIDIKPVNTVLFLRPTESLTVFLQQLGRGLRLDDSKECLTVLDFVGNHNSKYKIDNKYYALLSRNNFGMIDEIKKGFISVPKGCFIYLEPKISSQILEKINNSTFKNNLISNIRFYYENYGNIDFSNFLKFYNYNPETIYNRDSFANLKSQAKIIPSFNEPIKNSIKLGLKRISKFDSYTLIKFAQNFLTNLETFNFNDLNLYDKKLFNLFYIALFNKKINVENLKDVKDSYCDNIDKVNKNITDLINSPIYVNEILELLDYQLANIDIVQKPLNFGFENPLELYASYSTEQILSTFGYYSSGFQQGVIWFEKQKIDVLFVTLDKLDKDYSPSTLYNDYSIDQNTFHWQTQSKTSDNTETGLRYINHKENGSKILLCVRESKEDIYKNTNYYTILGFVNYKSHSGNKPMSIIFDLENPIPAKFINVTNKLILN